MARHIYKILSQADWNLAVAAQIYRGSPDDHRDGFIHFSAAHQVAATAEKYFSNQADLLIVAFSEDQFTDELKWEASRGGDEFPHLYGTLDPKIALWSQPLTLNNQGIPVIPPEVA